MAEIRAFKSAQEAIDQGFEDGAEDKKNGFTSEQFARELREAFKRLRDPGSPLYDDWRLGYAAGFNGLAKPPATSA